MADTASRGEGLRRLLVGLLLIPYMVLALVVILPVGLVLWIANNLWQIIVGAPLVGENSRIGYYLYWIQSNIQFVISGRGEAQWLP